MTAGGGALLFDGPAGMLGAAAVQVALAAGVSGKAALLFGRMTSFNGKPFWQLRSNLGQLFDVCSRTITRYFRELVDAGLIVNKPAPIGAIHPGCTRPLPYRPWYRWVIGLPELRQAVRVGSKEAYERWRTNFEGARQSRVTRSKLGAIIGSIVASTAPSTPKRATSSDTPPRRWTPDEIDAELSHTSSTSEPPAPAGIDSS